MIFCKKQNKPLKVICLVFSKQTHPRKLWYSSYFLGASQVGKECEQFIEMKMPWKHQRMLISLIREMQTETTGHMIFFTYQTGIGEGDGTPLQYSCLNTRRRSLVGCSPWGRQGSDMTETSDLDFEDWHKSKSLITQDCEALVKYTVRILNLWGIWRIHSSLLFSRVVLSEISSTLAPGVGLMAWSLLNFASSRGDHQKLGRLTPNSRS